MEKKNWIWIIALIVVVLLFLKPEQFRFSASGCEAKSNKVSFRTNNNGNYRDRDVWVVIDANNDGELDAYGYGGYSSYDCIDKNILGYTPEGYKVCLRPNYPWNNRIYVDDGHYGMIYKYNYKSAKNAITISTPTEPYTSNCQEVYDESGGDDKYTCYDSDGGKDTSVKGTITYGSDSYTDECSGSDVKEYFCEDNSPNSEVISCSSGYTCEDGVCVVGDDDERDCTDSDGGKNYYEKGTVKEDYSRTDNCMVREGYLKLVEYYCSDTITADGDYTDFVAIRCPDGYTCEDGACVESEQNTEADTNEDGCVSFSEFTTYANLWVEGKKTFDQFIESANAWASQEGCY